MALVGGAVRTMPLRQGAFMDNRFCVEARGQSVGTAKSLQEIQPAPSADSSCWNDRQYGVPRPKSTGGAPS